MNAHWYNIALELAFFFFNAGVAIAMNRRRMVQSWPFLFALTATDAAQTVVRAALQNDRAHYAAFFYTHWSGEIVHAVLFLGLLFNLVHQIPLARLIPAPAKLFFGTFTLALTAAAAYLACASHMPSAHRMHPLTLAAISLYKSTSIAWAVFALCSFATVSIAGLAWPEFHLRIGKGAMWQIGWSLPLTWAIAQRRELAPIIQPYADLLQVSAIPYWLFSIRATDRAHQSETEHAPDVTELQHIFRPKAQRPA